MPTKMRLQRFGKKGQPFYHIVIADGRAPRDGRLVEKIGTYNPLTRPADIKLDFDRALYWVQQGAVPTDTVNALLKYTGVAYMHHLLKGVKKNALTQEQANAKFEEWKAAKDAKISNAKNEIRNAIKSQDKARLEAEMKINQEKAEQLAKKYAAEAEAKAKAEAAENAEATEEVAAEATENVEAAENQTTEETTEDTPLN